VAALCCKGRPAPPYARKFHQAVQCLVRRPCASLLRGRRGRSGHVVVRRTATWLLRRHARALDRVRQDVAAAHGHLGAALLARLRVGHAVGRVDGRVETLAVAAHLRRAQQALTGLRRISACASCALQLCGMSTASLGPWVRGAPAPRQTPASYAAGSWPARGMPPRAGCRTAQRAPSRAGACCLRAGRHCVCRAAAGIPWQVRKARERAGRQRRQHKTLKKKNICFAAY